MHSALYEMFLRFVSPEAKKMFSKQPEAQTSGIADDSSAPGTVLPKTGL